MAKRSGSIAGNARKELEEELGQPVLTSKDATQLNEVVLEMIETAASIEKKTNKEK